MSASMETNDLRDYMGSGDADQRGQSDKTSSEPISYHFYNTTSYNAYTWQAARE